MTTVRFPSGMVGEFRGLSAADGRILFDENRVRDGAAEDDILQAAWRNLVDPGPYGFKSALVDWSKVLVGDRMFALIAIRSATYPNKPYVFPIQCTVHSCKKRFEWEFSIEKLMKEKVQSLSEEDVKTFGDGNRFSSVVPDTDIPFVFKLLTGADAKRAADYIKAKRSGSKKEKERRNNMVDSIVPHILEIGAVTSGKYGEIFDALEQLPLGSIDELLPHITAHDCGVDTLIDIECPFCSTRSEIELPFGQGFFMPKTAGMKKRTMETASPDDGR